MTNAEIILAVAIENNINEELHTFKMWKDMGYSVKKGEHGIEASLWKYSKGKKAEETAEQSEDGEEKAHGHYYMAKAYLFKRSQVEISKSKETK